MKEVLLHDDTARALTRSFNGLRGENMRCMERGKVSDGVVVMDEVDIEKWMTLGRSLRGGLWSTFR